MGKKIEKIVYIDDGRTIADMSNVRGGYTPHSRSDGSPRATLREQWSTFWSAMKMMFLPMLVVVGGLIVAYILLWVIFKLA